MNGVDIQTSGAVVELPEFDDDISKIVYPLVMENEKEAQYVQRAVKGRHIWVFWLVLAVVAFSVFMAATITAVDTIIDPQPKTRVKE